MDSEAAKGLTPKSTSETMNSHVNRIGSRGLPALMIGIYLQIRVGHAQFSWLSVKMGKESFMLKGRL
jgi:hypothetical protein